MARFSMAPRRQLTLPTSRWRARQQPSSLSNPGLGRPRLPAKGRCVALPVGPMAPSRGPVMAEMAFIACAVMSFIAGITDVMDLIACDEFIAPTWASTPSRSSSGGGPTARASRHVGDRGAHHLRHAAQLGGVGARLLAREGDVWQGLLIALGHGRPRAGLAHAPLQQALRWLSLGCSHCRVAD